LQRNRIAAVAVDLVHGVVVTGLLQIPAAAAPGLETGPVAKLVECPEFLVTQAAARDRRARERPLLILLQPVEAIVLIGIVEIPDERAWNLPCELVELSFQRAGEPLVRKGQTEHLSVAIAVLRHSR
jgi:hypothetical protein